MEKYIELKDLAIGYLGRAVVSGISLVIGRGEVLSVIGPNGSGKSTLLKTLSSQLERLSGGIIIDGRELSLMSLSEISRKISLLLTDRINPEYMTGRDIIEAGRYPYTGRFGILNEKDRQKVEEAVELAGVSSLADKEFSRMSDGEKQRVLFARAVCQEPDILIMDEPFSYLDIRYKLRMIDVIRKLSREKRVTVIMSNHELQFTGDVSDRIIALKDHGVFMAGTPEEIFKEEVVRGLYDLQGIDSRLLKKVYN